MKHLTLDVKALQELPLLSQTARAQILQELEERRRACRRKIVVLDDDPTGTQTVHDISVYTDWEQETLLAAFREPGSLFYILTNSRSFSASETEAVHRVIGERVAQAAQACGFDFILISRGDSTLRGHYPLETQTLRRAVEATCGKRYDGEIIFPFFAEGGRYTLNNIHYVQEKDRLIPAGQTEFANDKTFGYSASDLCGWCEEKTAGEYPASQVTAISLQQLRAGDVQAIERQLAAVSGFGKVIVNAVNYDDVAVFLCGFFRALQQGKEFLFRSAASLVKTIGGVAEQPLLDSRSILVPNAQTGGLVIVGSHVRKTTLQLNDLQNSGLPLAFIQYDQHKVLQEGGLRQETEKAAAQAMELMAQGKTAVVFTRRDRLDLEGASPEEQLKMSTEISDAIVQVVEKLTLQPRFLVAKGGITSSDIATKALRIWRAKVMGQVEPGIPVWQAGPESKFPGMAYVIFPGNVGSEQTLTQVVSKLL